MDEILARMMTYRAIVNNLIVKSQTHKLSEEELLFRDTGLAVFREDLRIHLMLLERQRENLERGMADGTFNEATGGGSQQGSSVEEP